MRRCIDHCVDSTLCYAVVCTLLRVLICGVGVLAAIEFVALWRG